MPTKPGKPKVGAFDVQHGELLWHEPFKGEGQAVVALAVDGTAVQGGDVRG